MAVKMKTVWIVLNTTLVVLLVGTLVWVANGPFAGPPKREERPAPPPEQPGAVLRLGLTPDRDIFAHRNRYRQLVDYLSNRLNRPVKLVTLSTYELVLKDFAEKEIDGAFLGSLVAVLAMDRLDAKVIVKPERRDGSSSYHGVIFVRDDSPIRDLDDLAGGTIAMVRTTTAGHVFPACMMMRTGLWERSDQPRIIWMGTHDDVATSVMEGTADVGAVKDLRLDALLETHSEWNIRRLTTSKRMPNNALILRSDLAEDLGPKLSNALLAMDSDDQGRKALKAMDVVRFVPCRQVDYSSVYDMVECVLPAWKQIGIPGPVPRRPAGWPKRDPKEQQRCYEESS